MHGTESELNPRQLMQLVDSEGQVLLGSTVIPDTTISAPIESGGASMWQLRVAWADPERRVSSVLLASIWGGGLCLIAAALWILRVGWRKEDELSLAVRWRTAQIEENERKLSAAMRVARLSYWEDDFENRVSWSEEGCRILGVPIDEHSWTWDRFMELVYPDDRRHLNESRKIAMQGKSNYQISFRVVHPDGEVQYFEAVGESVLGETGQPIRMVGAVQDVSERKRAEEALRESESRYRTFFEKGPDGVVILNPETAQIVEFNDQACRQLGFSREEFARLRVSDVEVKETAKETQERIGRVLEKGYSDFDTLQRTKQGEIRHVHVTAQLIETTGSNVYHCIWRDITERKRSEEALRESEEKYRTIFENIQDVYYETSLDGTILEISPSIENVSQYNRNELLGKSLYDIYANPEERDELLKLILDKGKVNDFEVALTDKDGSQRPCSISALLVRDEQANPIKIVGTMRDIGEKKRAENEKKRLEAQLLQSQKMEAIGNLAGGIAHDFNNILTSVIGFTELSLDEVEKGTHIEDNLQEVYTAGKRAKDLVRQILAFARQSGAELKPIYVDTIATEVLKFIRASIPTNIEIKQNIESDSLIMGNATQVHQILMNLFTNAAHAMEDNGGILEFSLKDVAMDCDVTQKKLGLKQGNYIEMKVSDTGIGIAPEIIGSIFDPYFTTKGPGEGTGMGLATVHGIIESYGGKISVDSKPGKGALFTIYLPVSRKRQEHDSYQSEKLPTGTERILFVDDEAPIAKMGGQVLEGLGYTVSIRTSSIEALELFRTKPDVFDLVITDMTMPNMTGDKLAVELMTIRPDIPVILCTGYSKKISDASASEMGIKTFLYKPVVNADLAKTVRKVLDEAKA